MAVDILGMQTSSAAKLFFFAWLGIAAVAALTLVFLVAFGIIGELVAVIFITIFGVPSALGVYPQYALPPLFRFISDWHPMRFATDGARSIVFFGGRSAAGLGTAIPVLFAYLVGSIVAGWGLAKVVDVWTAHHRARQAAAAGGRLIVRALCVRRPGTQRDLSANLEREAARRARVTARRGRGARGQQVVEPERSAWRSELVESSVFHRHRGEVDHQETVRILAIDGGGIRGIIPALILAEIEERTGRQAFELFDFIAGTSTGAILALGAATPGADGRGKWKARDGVDLYANRGREIFAKGRFSVGLFHEKYHHESFEKVLDDTFGDAMLSDAIVRCMATAYSLQLRQVHHFDSEEAKRDPDWDFPMKTVFRAATAAPTFFEPARFYSADDAEHLLLDGALYANNPAMIAFVEATRSRCRRRRRRVAGYR